MSIILDYLNLSITVITPILIWSIGRKQNEINKQALNISDFVEIFLMPQQMIFSDKNNQLQETVKWNVLIKNVSSYPIYLNKFTLNGIEHSIGSTAIPNKEDSWYAVPIPENVQEQKYFSLSISFEDYLGRKYKTKGSGVFDGAYWQIKSEKRIAK